MTKCTDQICVCFSDATTPAARLRAYNAVLELLFSTAPMLHVLASRMDGNKGGGGKILLTRIKLEFIGYYTSYCASL